MSEIYHWAALVYALGWVAVGVWVKPDTKVGDEWAIAFFTGSIWPLIPLFIFFEAGHER